MNADDRLVPAENKDLADTVEPTATTSRWQKYLGLIFGLIALVGILVMYWVPQYRGDEYISVMLRTQLSWSELFSAIRTDPAPGPFYILLKPWSIVSTDTWWMRLPIVFSMAATVGVLVGMVRRVLGPREAIFTGISMLALPAVSLWGTDVRPYSFAVLATVVAVALWWRSMDDSRVRWSVGYGFAVAAMGLMHLYTLTVIPTLLLMVLFLHRDDRVKKLLRTLIPAVLGVLLITPHIYLNLSFPTGSSTNPPVSIPVIEDIMKQMIGTSLMVAAVLAICLVGVFAAVRSRRERPAAVLAILWITVSAVLLATAHIVADISTMVGRYYVFLLPAVALLMGVGLGYLSQRWMPIAVIAITATFILGLPKQYDNRQFDGHATANRMASQMTIPELAGWPILGAVPGDDHIVKSAFYPEDPEDVLTTRAAPLEPVAVIFRWKANAMIPTPYLATDSGYKIIITCPLSGTRRFLIVANPEGVEEIGDVDELLAALNSPGPLKKKVCVLGEEPRKTGIPGEK